MMALIARLVRLSRPVSPRYVCQRRVMQYHSVRQGHISTEPAADETQGTLRDLRIR